MPMGDRRVQARAIVLVQLIAIIDHSQIDPERLKLDEPYKGKGREPVRVRGLPCHRPSAQRRITSSKWKYSFWVAQGGPNRSPAPPKRANQMRIPSTVPTEVGNPLVLLPVQP